MTQAAPYNDMPAVKMEDYESLAALHREKNIIKGKKTIQQSDFIPKETKLDNVTPPNTIGLGHPQISNITTYGMNFPSRGDYDPNRIFKRLQ